MVAKDRLDQEGLKGLEIMKESGGLSRMSGLRIV